MREGLQDLGRDTSSGPIQAYRHTFQIPQADGSSFTVEARRKAQWDRAIPADNSVVINQSRTDGRSFLVPHAGAYFTTGQMFTTPDPAVVVNIGPWQGDQVQIWAWDLPDGVLRQESRSPTRSVASRRDRWLRRATSPRRSTSASRPRRSRPDPTCEHIGEVESQSPAPGTVSQPGATVTIVIGTHPATPCP